MAKTELARDDFQRADGAIGSADVGGAWSTYTVAPTIVSNELQVALGTSQTSWLKLRSATTEDDTIVACLMKGTRAGAVAVEMGPTGRATTTNNAQDVGYQAAYVQHAGSSQRRLVERSGNTTTTLTSDSPGTLAPDTWRWSAIVLEGTAQRAYFWNPGQLPPTTPQLTASDGTLTAAGVPGGKFTTGASAETINVRRYLATDLAAPGEASGFGASYDEGTDEVTLTWTRPTDRGAAWCKLFRNIGSAADTGDTLLTGSATDLSGIASDGRFGGSSWWDWSTFTGPDDAIDDGHGGAPGDTIHYLLVTYDIDGEPSTGVAASVEIPEPDVAADCEMTADVEQGDGTPSCWAQPPATGTPQITITLEYGAEPVAAAVAHGVRGDG